MKEINPGMAAAVIVVLLVLAGGIWFFASKGPGNVPSTGQAGRSDPMLSGANPILKSAGKAEPSQVRGGTNPGMPRPGSMVPAGR